MKKGEKERRDKIRPFSASLFWVYLIVLFLMSGFHTGIIVLANTLEWNKIIQVVIAILYWSFVAVGLTLFTRNKIQKNYEKPMHDLAEATKKISKGDFSVYVPTINTSDRLDYLDIMIIDFNKMVEELGSIETLKTDFFSNVSHESKSPLAIIQNNAELLCMETEPKNKKNMQRLSFVTETYVQSY